MGTQRADTPRMRRLSRAAIVAALAVLLLLSWPAWTILQARLAVANSPAARRVVVGCEGLRGWTLVYHVTLLGHGGAVCSAIVHQDAFYSYVMSKMSDAQWLRDDCEVSTPRDLPYCSERTLRGPATWGLLLGSPAPDLQKLSATGTL